MNVISIVLVVIVAFLAGMEGILDEFQFHQPLVACTLIGIVCGQPAAGIILGGSLQMIAMGWANIGAAVAPDAALASVASAIILMKGGQGAEGASTAIAVAIPLAVAGLFLTMVARTALCVVPAEVVSNLLNSMPAWLTDGMSIGGGMVVAVGYALVINMMATAEVWPFFFIGFALAAISDLTLIGLGIVAVAIAFIYLNLSEKGGSAAGGAAAGGSGDPLGDILNDY